MKNRDQCCSHDCRQGRTCPRRTERRSGPTTLWRRFWQMMREKRDGFDRRERLDTGDLPVFGPHTAVVYDAGVDPMRDDEAKRLRRVVNALDMGNEVPDDDATLRDCLFSVLGQIAYKLERARPVAAHLAAVDEIHNQALEEAAKACLSAVPDRARVKALGESGHYSTCAAVIRALKRTSTCEASNG